MQAEGGSGFCRWYYFARHRKRMHHSQVTHVLVACLAMSDDTMALEQTSPCTWAFRTVWDIALAFLLAGGENLSLFPGNVDEDTHATVKPRPMDFDDDALSGRRGVWPDAYKRPRKPARPLDGPQKKKGKKKKSQGILAVPPGETALLDQIEPSPVVVRRRRARPDSDPRLSTAVPRWPCTLFCGGGPRG